MTENYKSDNNGKQSNEDINSSANFNVQHGPSTSTTSRTKLNSDKQQVKQEKDHFIKDATFYQPNGQSFKIYCTDITSLKQILIKDADTILIDIIIDNVNVLSYHTHLSDFVKNIEKNVIVQCSGSDLKTFVYYKNINNKVVVNSLDTNGDLENENVYKRLNDRNIDFDIIIDGIKLKLIGEFNPNTPKNLLNLKTYELPLLALIYLSAQYNTVVLKYLLILTKKCLNFNYMDGLFTQQQLNVNILKQEINKIHDDLYRNFEKSVENEEANMVEFAIKINCVNINQINTAAKLANRKQKYNILLLLLKADADIPRINNTNEQIRDLIENRNNLHEMIKQGNVAECLNLIKKLGKSKLYLNSNNESALVTAIDTLNLIRRKKIEERFANKILEICAQLKINGVQFKNQMEERCINEMNEADREKLKTIISEVSPNLKNAEILYLLSKTKKLNCEMDEIDRAKFERWYKNLTEVETVDVIFSVVENCDYLSILYDFDDDSVCSVNPTVLRKSGIVIRGLTIESEGKVYIGAKQDETIVLGTIAHELTHVAMNMVFDNEGKPYYKDTDSEITMIADQLYENRDKIDKILSNAFTYEKPSWTRELIARVPQMLVVHKSDVQLNDQAKDLFKDNILDIKQIFKSLICNTLIVIVSEPLKDNDDCFDNIKALIKDKYPQKRLIIIFNKSITVQLGGSEICEMANYSLINLTNKTQQRIMMKKVEFQDKTVELNEVIDESCDDCLKLISSDILTNIITENKPLVKIGKIPPLPEEYQENLYIERSFNIDVNKSDLSVASEEELMTSLANNDRVILISDTAGMGKTTVLTKISQLIKNHWLIRIDLNNYTKIFDDVINEILPFRTNLVESLVKFLIDQILTFKSKINFKPIIETDFEKKLLQHFFKKKGKVIVMFDGFDEISPHYQAIVLKLILALQATEAKQIWITTRPNMQKYLENNIKSTTRKYKDALNILMPQNSNSRSLTKLIIMQKFTHENQINFLVKFWLSEYTWDSDVNEKLKLYAEKLIKSFSKAINDNELEFTGNPLITKMLATVYKDQIEKIITLNLTIPEKIEINSLDSLYENFINEKLKIHELDKRNTPGHNVRVKEDMEDMNKQFYIRRHEIASIMNLFNLEEQNILFNENDKIDSEKLFNMISDGGGNTGIIIQIINDKPQFVHRTFAEYFAKKFIKKILERKSDLRLIEFLLDPGHKGNTFSFLRLFLDELIGTFTVDEKVKSLLKQLSFVINNMLSQKSDNYNITALHIFACENLKHITWLVLNSFEGFFNQLNFDSNKTISNLCISQEQVSINDKNKTPADIDKFYHYINKQDEEYNTPLHSAVTNGHLSIIKLIINHCNFIGVDVHKLLNGYKLDSNALLLFAVDKNQMHIVKYLVEEVKVNVNVVSHHNYNITNKNIENPFCCDAFTALHIAAVKNNQPMAVAIYGHLDMVQYLIKKGANPKKILKMSNVNALHFASLNKEMDIFDYLVKKRKLNFNEKGCFCSPLHIMAEYGHIDRINYCIKKYGTNINETAMDGRNVLHFAAENGQFEMVKYLITKHKIPIHSTCINGKTVLHYAVSNCGRNLYSKFDIIKFLVKIHKADINAKDHLNETPLDEVQRHVIAYNDKDSIKMAEYLLNRHQAKSSLEMNSGCWLL
ncbi:hypothetical protein CHUAL_010748 [Chamberlinius hualienensis]